MSPRKKTAVREYFYFRHSMDNIGKEIRIIKNLLESFSIEQLKEVPVDIGIIDSWAEDLRKKVLELMKE